MTPGGPSSSDPLPTDLGRRVHRYLEGFVSPARAAALRAEVAEEVRYWGDERPVTVFAAAHRALAAHLRIAAPLDAMALAEDAGLAVEDIAVVLGVTVGEVRRLLGEALTELADPDAPGAVAPPDRRPEGGRGQRPTATSIEATAPTEPTPVTPPTAAEPPDRRWLGIAALLVGFAVAAVLAMALATG